MALPQPYHRWLVEALGAPIPVETRATCGDCVMVSPGAGPTEERPYNPATKCCTYEPSLPSYQVGAMLKAPDAGGARARGQELIRARIRSRSGATPIGLFPSPRYWDAYVRGYAQGMFGRDPALACSFLSEGDCTVWQHWAAVCATWYCLYDRAAIGARFWQTVRTLLETVERNLSTWCGFELGLEASQLEVLFDPKGSPRSLAKRELPGWVDEGGALDADLARRAWGPWYGREEDYYRRCTELVEGLAWSDVRSVIGAPGRFQELRVRTAFLALTDSSSPEVLCLGSFVREDGDDGRSVVYTKEAPRDRASIEPGLVDLLERFDGRPTPDVLLELHARGLDTDLQMVERLHRIGVLVPPDGLDVPLKDQDSSAVRPDERIAAFRGFRAERMSMEVGTGPDGQEIVTLTAGCTVITFDDPELVPFAKRLFERQNGFIAREAMTWTAGRGSFDWEPVRQVLTTLIKQRVLQRLPSDAPGPTP